MILCPATAADAAAIATLHAESWRAAYRGMYSDDYLDGPVFEDRLRVWNERFSPPSSEQFVLLGLDGDDVLGFVCAYGRADPTWGTLIDTSTSGPTSSAGAWGGNC
jgi:hypothetical protein